VDGALNPFVHPDAVANSNYSCFDGTELQRVGADTPPSPLTRFVHAGVRALILNDQFVCVGGKSALHRGTYRFGLYSALGSPTAAAGLARDLFTFVQEMPTFGNALSTFIASFEGPHPTDEAAFEGGLWRTLQTLHALDVSHHDWDPAVSADPDDERFSFSFGGTAFFVVGLHAASSRAARRFAWPTLTFNPHRQFEALREEGAYARFQRVIRRAEVRLQGDSNPMLADFGARSEARQYSGRRVGAGWRCPFHAFRDRATAKD
jgi:uncharacterized protein